MVLLAIILSAPVEDTVDIGSLSFDPRKDIRNGTSATWLMAFNALFEVSLDRLINLLLQLSIVKNTHERHHNTVMTLSANS